MPVLDGLQFLKQALTLDPDAAVLVLTGVGDVQTAVEVLNGGAYDFIQKPVDPEQLLLTAGRALERRQLVVERRQHQELLERRVTEATSELAATVRHLEESYLVTLEALGSAIDTRDVGTHAHSRRVRGYSLAIARAHGVPESQIPDIEHGVLLHDIGKIGIPDAILLKPGPLTPEEWTVMRSHPEIGRRLVEKIPFLRGAVSDRLPPPRAVGRHGLPARAPRRGDPARAAHLRARGRARCHDLRPPVLARDLIRDGAGRDQALCGHALRSRGRRHLPDHPAPDVRGHPAPQPARHDWPPTPRPRRCAPPSAAPARPWSSPSASEWGSRRSALHDDRSVTTARQSLGGGPSRLAVGIRAQAHPEEGVAPDLGLGDRRDVTIPGQRVAQALGPRPAGEGAHLDGELSGRSGAGR